MKQLIALVHKSDYAYLCNDPAELNLKLNGEEFTVQGFYKTLSPGGNPRRELSLVLAKYSRCSTASCSSLLIQVADDNVYPMEYLHRITKGLDESQFISLLGMLKQKPAEARSPTEAAIYKCRPEIGRLRELSNKEAVAEQANVVTIRNARLHVQQSGQFNNIFLGLALEFADRSVWPYNLPEGGLTCGDWFAYPELHGSLSLFVSGLPRMGKTEVCKTNLFKLGLRRSPDNARMAIFQTIDQTREVQIGTGDVILFDDIDPSDHQNLVHSSAGIWKNILQTSQLCQFRCRNKDTTIPVRVPRIVTTNIGSLQRFVQFVAPGDDTDQAATMLRIAHVRVEQNLYNAPARATQCFKGPYMAL